MDHLTETHYIFPRVHWKIENIDHNGPILDIGGGGEGVIGRLMGKDVVAIDINKEELLEAADGPLKIVMDARNLLFLDNSFQTATAFFSLMYLKEKNDQEKVFQEISRVLEPGGKFHFWDVDLINKPDTDKEIFIVSIQYTLGKFSKETGYGMRWPQEPRGYKQYLEMAEDAGFEEEMSRWEGNTFYICLTKK